MEIQELTVEQQQVKDMCKGLFNYDEYKEIYTVNANDEITSIIHSETTREGEPTALFMVKIEKQNKQTEFTLYVENIENQSAYCGGFKSHIDINNFMREVADIEFCEKDLGYLGWKRLDVMFDKIDFDELYNKFVEHFKVNHLCMEIIEKFILDINNNLDEFREFMIENFKGEFATEQLYDIFHKQVEDMEL